VLAGCSTYGGSSDPAPPAAAPTGAAGASPPGPATAAPGGSAPAGPPPADPGGSAPAGPPPAAPGGSAPAGPPALARVSDIPVGGGRIFEDRQVVVTQPQAGTIKAFSSICTHQGCAVTKVERTIECTCHGSRFDVADGSVASGPAPRGLPAVPVNVDGDAITLA
jgi:Rieske Fe-S protein